MYCVCCQTVDLEQYYMTTDTEFLANNIMMDIAFLTMNWRHMLGRPTYIIVASASLDGKKDHFYFVRDLSIPY